MNKMKVLASVLLALMVLFAQVGSAAAAPQTQDGTVTVTGTVTGIGDPVTDENGVTMVPVTIMDENEVETTILVTPEVAAGLTVDPDNPETVTLTGTVAPPEEEADVHPIAALLGEFFDVDPSLIDSLHTGDNEAEHVFGFGVIAQALWMATETDSEEGTSTTDIELATAILVAKQTGDYEDVAKLLGWEGDEPPTNWGQFKKAFKEQHENLGAAVSNQKNENKGKSEEHKKPKEDKPHGNPHNP